MRLASLFSCALLNILLIIKLHAVLQIVSQLCVSHIYRCQFLTAVVPTTLKTFNLLSCLNVNPLRTWWLRLHFDRSYITYEDLCLISAKTLMYSFICTVHACKAAFTKSLGFKFPLVEALLQWKSKHMIFSCPMPKLNFFEKSAIDVSKHHCLDSILIFIATDEGWW